MATLNVAMKIASAGMQVNFSASRAGNGSEVLYTVPAGHSLQIWFMNMGVSTAFSSSTYAASLVVDGVRVMDLSSTGSGSSDTFVNAVKTPMILQGGSTISFTRIAWSSNAGTAFANIRGLLLQNTQ